jgi:sodium transport system ATP-binding protein
MIEIEHLQKFFVSKNNKKKSAPGGTSDPRQEGRLFYAVRDVSFHCERGQVLGLLGPNGAGKTTTLRMLSTALQPSAGRIVIDGVDAVQNPVRARQVMGFLSGTTGLYRRLTARENIEYFARLHGVPEDTLSERLNYLFDRLDMHAFADKRADDLSTGMKQKTSIARAVIHDPDVVVFDEPTTGLDVLAARTVIEFIEEFKQQGKTVIFSTHHLHEVARLCDTVCVIHYGKSLFFGALTDFQARSQSGDLYEAFMAVVNESSEVGHVAGV